jgi:hypothetical protein
MVYQIAVRTYERARPFQSKTLQVLRDCGLTETLTVFVGSDIAPYRALEPDLRYVQVRKGGANAIADICAYYERDTPILFLDDDLESFYGGHLPTLIEQGFARADVWGFGFITNKFWLTECEEWGPRYATLAGCAFGARNRPEIIVTPTGHCGDLTRTVKCFQAGVIPHIWKKAGFKTRYAKNAGGLQSSGERDDTKAVCESLLPQLEGWVRGLHQLKCGYWAVRLLPAATLRAKLRGGVSSDIHTSGSTNAEGV